MWTADKNVNMKAIFAVMNTTWAVVKIRPDFSDHFYYCSSSVHYCEDRFHIRIFNLVMHWSSAVVFGAQATTAYLKTLTGKLIETRLMCTAQAYSMENARMRRRNWDRFEATSLPRKLKDKTFTVQHHFVYTFLKLCQTDSYFTPSHIQRQSC